MSRKTLSLFLALLMIAAAVVTVAFQTTAAEGGEIGDVNGDGKINAIDASLILQFDAKLIGETALNTALADVSGDGKVNAIDASLILQYDAKLITDF